MGILDSMIDGLDDFSRGIRDLFGRSINSYCDLETAVSGSDHIWIAKDGSCMSLVEWNGANGMVGVEEYELAVQEMTRQLSSSMVKTGHAIQVVFGCDRSPELGASALESHFAPMYAAAAKLRLNLGDVLDDRKAAMAKHCAPEYCYVALWTRTSILPPAESKTDRERHLKATRDLPRGKRAQAYYRGSQAMVDTHRSFAEFFVRDISRLKLDVKLLPAHKAGNVIRSLVDGTFTDSSWTPTLPGDPLTVRESLTRSSDPSNLLWAPLLPQLVPRDPHQLDLRTVQVGDRIWSPLVVTLPQKNPRPFTDLFHRLRSVGIPWRISINIAGNGLDETRYNQSMASMLTIAGRANKEIDGVYKALQELRDKGNSITSLRICAATWAPSSNRAKLSESSARLARAIQGWGGCEVNEATGNPTAGFFCTVPGIRYSNIAPASNPPLGEALKLLPWGRPASPWPVGNFLLRTPDGKPFPYSAYSGLQSAWITLISSPMGGGKSVQMNGLNLGLVLDSANETLPLIRILDIGPSSSGFTSLISSALPRGEQHKSQYHRIRNTQDYSFNPCDTPLGQRYPLSAHRDFLVSLLCLLCTPLDASAPEDGIAGIAKLVVDAAYKRFSDDDSATPRIYSKMASEMVDAAIEKHSLVIDQDTTWWELCDTFHELGDLRAAYAAHRQAMPLLIEMATLAKDESIVKEYPDIVNGSLPITDFFRRKISEAVSQYQVLSRHTRFDIGDSPIISLDLDEVAKSGSAPAERQTTVMYLLSLWMLSNEFFIGDEILPDMHPKYRAYHTQRVDMLKRVKKRLCADEFHRPAKSSPIAVQVIEQVIREGRKWQVEVVLCSQKGQDFPKDIVDLATVVFIMQPPLSGAESMQEAYNLSPTEMYNINNFLRGPEPGVGANCFARFVTKKGKFSHLLTNTAGSIENWAFSTTAEDKAIRQSLYKVMPPDQARRLLARRFPFGAKSEVERRVEERNKSGVPRSMSVTDEILGELIQASRLEALN